MRVDSGVLQGTEINMFYDSMLAKLITWGPDRDQAIDRMKLALDNYVIKGLVHNIPICYDLVNNPRFRAGDTNTGFIPEEYPQGFKGFRLSGEDRKEQRNQLIASAAYIHTARPRALGMDHRSIPLLRLRFVPMQELGMCLT